MFLLFECFSFWHFWFFTFCSFSKNIFNFKVIKTFSILDFIKKRHVLLVIFCLCFSNNNQFSSIRFYQLCVWGYCSTIFVLDFSFQKENGLLSLLSSPSKKCHHLLPYYLCVRDCSNFELQILRNGEGGEGGQTFRWKSVTAKFETLRWRYSGSGGKAPRHLKVHKCLKSQRCSGIFLLWYLQNRFFWDHNGTYWRKVFRDMWGLGHFEVIWNRRYIGVMNMTKKRYGKIWSVTEVEGGFQHF